MQGQNIHESLKAGPLELSIAPISGRPRDAQETRVTDAVDVAGADAAGPAARTSQTPLVQTRFLVPAAIALGSLLAGAIYTWFVGEDVNWDWMNYHEYNVWAVINDRYGVDAMPAGFQTYFNPVVYFPIYYLRH